MVQHEDKMIIVVPIDLLKLTVIWQFNSDSDIDIDVDGYQYSIVCCICGW